MSKRPEKLPEQKTTPNQQAIEDLSWDIVFFRTVWNFFVREGKVVKNGWVAIIIIVGISVWITHLITKGSTDDVISNLKGQLADAKQDRDKYQVMLAPFEAMALAKYTNAPLDQRLDLLTHEMDIVNNALSSMGNEKPNLGIIANEQTIESNATIHITKRASRTVQFLIINIGHGTASSLAFIFMTPLDRTNILVGNGWFYGGHGFVDNKTWNHWDVTGTRSIPSGGFTLTPCLTISSNYSEATFPAAVSVYADNAIMKTYPVIFKFDE
jgi:hypothetical protein